ncbi:MAG: hypothetical protein ACO3PB_05630, partial [Miltoncostaeaceae bacterium]
MERVRRRHPPVLRARQPLERRVGWSAGEVLHPAGQSCEPAAAAMGDDGVGTVAITCWANPADITSAKGLFAVRGVPGAWVDPVSLSAPAANVSSAALAVAADGAVGATWTGTVATGGLMEARVLPAGAATWGSIHLVGDASRPAISPALAATGPGTFTAAWVQAGADAGILTAAITAAGVSDRLLVSDPAAGPLPSSDAAPSLSARTVDGTPVTAVAWEHGDRVMARVSRAGVWGDATQVSVHSSAFDYVNEPAAVVAGDGAVTVAWTQRIDG